MNGQQYTVQNEVKSGHTAVCTIAKVILLQLRMHFLLTCYLLDRTCFTLFDAAHVFDTISKYGRRFRW